MDGDFLLLNPGPVPVADDVLASMDEPIVSHRSPEFEAVYERAQTGLDYAFTRSTPDETRTAEGGTSLILNGTATMGMEAAVANLATEGRVVCLVNGKFGERFARIAERHADVTRLVVPWGDPFDIDDVAAVVDDGVDVVTMVHTETSTGLRNPLAEVGELARDHGAYLVVDAVTTVGGDEFRVDDWAVDVAITDPQKALGAPPGVSAMFVTPRAADGFDGESAPFYLDLERYLRKAVDHQTPFTSAIPLFRALAAAVDRIREEGMAARLARHRRLSAAFRAGFTAMGLDLFADGAPNRSNTVTTVFLPERLHGDDSRAFFDAMAARNASVAGGQGHLAGRLFRVGNMGAVDAAAVRRGVRTVGEALGDAGADVAVAAGVEAAEDVLGRG